MPIGEAISVLPVTCLSYSWAERLVKKNAVRV